MVFSLGSSALQQCLTGHQCWVATTGLCFLLGASLFGKEAGELPLPFVAKEARLSISPTPQGSMKLIHLEKKKTGEGSSSLSSGTTESHRATQNMFPSALWSCKFMLQPLEPGRAGFASSLVRCLSEKARGVQKNALWKWVDDPVPARGKRKCHFPDDRAKIASKGRGSPLLRGLSLTIRESEPFG